MAPIASSSSSASRPRPHKDLFKPKFPLDPFSGHSAAALGEPWFLKTDALLNATAVRRRNAIFVVGAPSLTQLGPLLQSHQLVKSLVILATHKPPDIPGIVYPTVRILRLKEPLGLEDAGAVRFVNVLEWAERVARTWRKHGGAGVLELSEESDINSNRDLQPPPVFRFGSQSTPPSPRSSTTHLSGQSSAPPSRPSSRMASRPPSIVSMFFLNKGPASLPPPDPSQRPFDVVINFLPEKISDKALLKNAILVTTISRPFLKASYGGSASSVRTRATSSSSSPSSPRFARPRSIFGAFSRSSSSLSEYIPSTPQNLSGESLPLSSASASLPPPLGKALLVHLLPSPHPKEPPGARRRLVDSMETFLLSFSFHSVPGMQSLTPTQARTSTYSPGTAPRPVSGAGLDVDFQRARSYLMQTSTFCDSIGAASDPALASGLSGSECGEGSEWTVADVVLSGALDGDMPAIVNPHASAPLTSTSTMTSTPTLVGADGAGKLTRRAWIAAAADLVIVPSGDERSPSPSPSPSHGVPHAHAHTHAHGHVPGAALPSRTTRSSSVPLLSAGWAPVSFGGRPLSLSQPRTPSQPAAVVSSSSSSSSGSGSGSSSGCSSTLSPPPMSTSSTLTPPSSEDSGCENGGVADVEKAARGSGVGLAVAVSVDGSLGGAVGAKGSKVVKWKFWRRKAGANVAEVGA